VPIGRGLALLMTTERCMKVLVTAAAAALLAACAAAQAGDDAVQPGSRPISLVENMDPGPLKTKLLGCSAGPFKRTDFSIGHRGAAQQFPEHTRESYEAAARMGAGIVECDVTFTRDRELVCRHSQCDLHTTTDILATPLAAKCSEAFRPAAFDATTGKRIKAASAKCCTSDLTLAEFKTLRGKMDAGDPDATTVDQYLAAPPGGRADLASLRGTLVSHKESIALLRRLGVKMIPELKAPEVPMPYRGTYRQEDYARQMIDEYRAAGVSAAEVWPQSFDIDDVLYWLKLDPAFGAHAVYLDGTDPTDGDPGNDRPPTLAELQALAAKGVRIVAPPIWALLTLDGKGEIVPSAYARDAKAAGLDIIAWTLERSGSLKSGGGWYYQSIAPAINNDGDMLTVLDVLARQVGVRGVFSDWPGTVTYHATCMGLE
jgi:glycerophosphoryl diester phosphodiesterase